MTEHLIEPTRADSTTVSPAPAVDPIAVFSKLNALQALNLKLVLRSDEHGVYQEMVEAAARIIGCDYCALLIPDSNLRHLVVRACFGYSHHLNTMQIGLDDLSRPQIQAFSEEYLVYVDDLDRHPENVRLSPDLRCELDIPIQGDLVPFGLFHFGNRAAASFSQPDIQLCSMVVDQLAHSMANIRLLEELTESRDVVIRGMAIMAESRDAHIGGHLDRICQYSELLAGELSRSPRFQNEVNDEFVTTLTRAAPLHDIGKVSIPDHILLKPAKLTAEEFEIMKTHTWRGEEILRRLMAAYKSNYLMEMGATIAKSHHEFWNGEGYPAGLKEREIPLAARIVSICDVYDALVSVRPYKEAWDHEHAAGYIVSRSGEQFDPWLVQVFQEKESEFLRIREEHTG